MRKTIILIAFTFLAGAGLAGCATNAASSGPQVGDEGNTTLIVDNATSVGALSVYLLPRLGSRSFVGHVPAGRTATLEFNVTSPGQYRFIAETLGGAEAASNEIFFEPGALVEWNVSTNIARVET